MVIAATLIPPARPDVGPSRDEIAAVAARIVEQCHPEQIRLFGSRAYGVPHEGSDVDLLVIWDTALPRREARQQIGGAIEAPRSHRYQIHVYTPFEIRRGLREHDFFIEDMMLKGIALYERRGALASEEDGPPYAAAGSEVLKHAAVVWLARASEAASSAERLLTSPTPSPQFTCFLAQQGVELTLKALLQQHGIHFPRTHNLDALAKLALPFGPALAEYRAALKTLTTCAVEARYTEIDVSPAQADAAVQTMRAVRALILAVLPRMPDDSLPAT